MPAQDGGSLVLSYGPQGDRQNGGGLVLAAIAASTSRRIAGSTRATWSASTALQAPTHAPIAPSLSENVGATAAWQATRERDAEQRAAWLLGAIADTAAAGPWGRYEGRAQLQSRARWSVAQSADETGRAPWGRFEGRAELQAAGRWTFAVSLDLAEAAPWGGPMVAANRVARAVHSVSVRRDRVSRMPWSRIGRRVVGRVEVVIPVHEGAPEALFVVPVRRVYMQVNSASLTRVDTGQPLRAFRFNLGLDVDSWAWSFGASLPASDLDLVRPTEAGPVELEAIVNGTAFRVLVEGWTRDREFAKSVIQIRGRGKAAYLDAPYASVLNFANDADRTLQQLMADVLTENGVPLGWAVNFAPEDWLVPAGVFTHRGSYMSALNTLAAAAGAYVQPHPTDEALSILSRYPAKPWEWATLEPDYELPSALMTREGLEWVDKPIFNRVYVSGVQAGHLGQITRAGSAGDRLAPMVTDPLMTDPAALRQRAMPILCDVGSQEHVTLSFPVLSETGLVLPGKFVRYIDGATTRIGLARSLSLDVSMGENEAKIRQAVKLETHL